MSVTLHEAFLALRTETPDKGELRDCLAALRRFDGIFDQDTDLARLRRSTTGRTTGGLVCSIVTIAERSGAAQLSVWAKTLAPRKYFNGPDLYTDAYLALADWITRWEMRS